MKKHYIKELISEGEGLHLDFKYEVSDAKKIARSLVAFANTDGGKLLIGVNDEGIIKGIQSEEEKFMIALAAKEYCKPKVAFITKEWNMKGKKVLEVDIPISNDYPHKAPDQNGRYKVYIRFKDQNLIADSILIKIWNKEKSLTDIQLVYTDDLKQILHFIQQNEPVTVDDLKMIFNMSKFEAEQLLSDLIIFDVLNMEITETSINFYLTDLADS